MYHLGSSDCEQKRIKLTGARQRAQEKKKNTKIIGNIQTTYFV